MHIFSDISGKQYCLSDIVERARLFIAAKPSERYEIIVGSDSHPAQTVQFVTAVTVRRIGNGGIYFWTRSNPEQCHTLRDRIYRETMCSITLAQELRGRLKETLGDEFFWNDQVHIDVGERGATRDLIPGVVGMVRGFGFEAVIKPYAFGACTVADRHT
ncbi:MAG: hypothetical protein G01um101429_192 [Parcubacteria group bacterium Gr01-1014_29]|nr:MAG: hypothetical protein G01um101429_192 [Parcubacteria group bacterium Gr01-1014_29]